MQSYQIYCNTERTYVSGMSVIAPITCYTDPTHSVDLTNVSQIPTISANVMFVTEEKIQQTNGTYRCDTLTISAAPNSTTNYPVSFPVMLYMMRVIPDLTPSNIGDAFSIKYPVDTPISVVATDLPANTTLIPLSSTVIYSMRNGYCIDVDIAGVITSLGRIINVSSDGVTVQTPYPAIIPAGSYIMLTVSYIENYFFATANLSQLSAGRTNGAYIPANANCILQYVNNSLTDTKSFTVHYEYLY